MAHSQTYFHNAHHFEVNDANFFNISNTNTIINNDPVSTTLWQHVATGAMFDSAERYPPGKCHPGTRENVSNKIVDWMDDLDPDQRILWLYGPAGSGKSAICQSLCERLSKTDSDRLGGSFFFAKGLTDRGNSLKLFATLSYQLAIHFPSVRKEINEALDRDPSLPTKSMDVQLFSLIIQPLIRCQPFQAHPTLIIDGLDECADDQGMDIQRNIITLIAQSIIEYNVPLRFMIASRPEFWIRDTFETAPLPNLTLSISLRDDADADHDIRAYLTDEFEKIRLQNKRIMGSVSPPWPPANIVDRFVYEASGQFIYASTIVKFVGKSSRFSDPQEQLRILTTSGPQRASAFSELDRLYATILSAYPRWATMKRVLGGILMGANATILETILGIEPNEIILVSDALSALVDVKRPGPLSEYELLLDPIFGPLTSGQETMELFHLSFRDFLEDETRSGPFHVDTHETIVQITDAFFGIICRNIDDKYARAPHRALNIGIASYWPMIDIMSSVIVHHSETASLVTWLTHLTQKLSLDLDVKLDHIGCFLLDMYLMYGIWGRKDKDDNLMSTILEFDFLALSLQRRHTQRLVSSEKFRPTLPLVYLSDGIFRDINEIFSIIPGSTADIFATFQEHRHLIIIFYDNDYRSLWCGGTVIRHAILDEVVDEGWLAFGQWRDHRISIVSRSLHRILIDHDGQADLYSDARNFFKSRKLSDIRSSSYFENECNIIILALITDCSAWAGLFCPKPYAQSAPFDANFLSEMLCWFSRHLTNPETLNILENQEKDLVPRMRTTTKKIFQDGFLPIYRRPYCGYFEVDDLYIPKSTKRVVRLSVFALTQGSYILEEGPPNTYITHAMPYPGGWPQFHNEVFGKKLPTSSVGFSPALNVIGPQDWHPYLATHILESLIIDLYRCGRPVFKRVALTNEEIKEIFSCLVECYPYAETTQQNLDALRAIAYFFPKAVQEPELDPPLDFWTSSLEFLKKYDRSMLSYEELQLFEDWIGSMHREAMGRNQQ